MQSNISEQTVAQTNAGWRHWAFLAQEDWDSHLPFFRELYLKEQRTLDDVIKVMEEKLGFTATKKMYKTNFKRLRLLKNRTKTTEEADSADVPATNEVALTESARASNAVLERTSGMAIVPGAGQHTIKRPLRSLSSSGVNACAEVLLWHINVLSKSWRKARSNTSSLLIQTSRAWNMLLGDSPITFSLFDMRQGLEALNEACVVTSRVMSQESVHLLPIMLVEFCSKWWSHFPGLWLSLLRYLTKLGAVKLGTRHPLTVILFHLTDENVAFSSITAAIQILTQAAERELPLLDRPALSFRSAECCMNIDAMQYHAALASVESLHRKALSVYGPRGVLTRSVLLRKGEIQVGLGAIEAAELNYEEALRLSEGQHCRTALDAVGIAAATRLAALYLTSGDNIAAQQLCSKALANLWTPFSKPGYGSMGLTLKVMLEETLIMANAVLKVNKQQDVSHNLPGDHSFQRPTQETAVPLNRKDYTAARATLKSSTMSSFSAVQQVEVEVCMERTAEDKDPFVMIHDHIVRQATSESINAWTGGNCGGRRLKPLPRPCPSQPRPFPGI